LITFTWSLRQCSDQDIEAAFAGIGFRQQKVSKQKNVFLHDRGTPGSPKQLSHSFDQEAVIGELLVGSVEYPCGLCDDQGGNRKPLHLPDWMKNGYGAVM
jgi:hypothetical protein